MPSVIPTFNTGTTSYNVALNGTTYFFKTYWNEYAAMWFLDILDSDGNNVAMGLALVPDINIFRYDTQLTNTIGELRVADLTGEGNAKDDSLGNTALLYYFLPGEFQQLYPNYNVENVRPQQFDLDELYPP